MRAALCVGLLGWLFSACRAQDDHAGEGRGRVVMLVASSLTDVANALLEGSSEGRARVRVSAMGSQAARLQIVHGAEVDCFVSADRAQVDALAAEGMIQGREVVAHNALVLAVPKAGASQVRDLRSLPQARRIVLGTAASPIGAYSRELLRRLERGGEPDFEARVMARVVSLESNVRLVLAKVALGEADAALVYRTDAVGRPVRAIPIEAELNPKVTYELAVTKGASTEAAARCRALWRDDAAQKVLEAHGFVVPSTSRANVLPGD